MISKRIWTIFLPLFLFFLLLVGGLLFLNSLIQNPSFQQYLLARISHAVGYQIRTGPMEFSFWHGIGVSAPALEAKSSTGSVDLTASRVKITLDATELIHKRIVPTRVFLLEPKIELSLKKGPDPSRSHNLKQMVGRGLAVLPALSMEKGQVLVKDYPFAFKRLFLSSYPKGQDPVTVQISLRGDLCYRGEEAPFILRGHMVGERPGQGPPSAHFALEAPRIPFKWIPKTEELCFKEGYGQAKITMKGTLKGPLSARGKILSKDLVFTLTDDGQTKTFSPTPLGVDFKTLYARAGSLVTSATCVGPGFSLDVAGTLNLRDRANPHLDLKVKAPPMALKTFKGLFPSPLVPWWMEGVLFPLLTGGRVAVERFSLNGTIQEIEHLDRPENKGALCMKLAWEDIEVLRDGGGLPFTGVSGHLSLEQGDLSITQIKGSSGSSALSDASLTVPDLFSKAPLFKTSVQGRFDLQDLMKQTHTTLLPGSVRRIIPNLETLEGQLEARVAVDYKSTWKHPELQQGTFSLTGCTFSHKDLALPLRLEHGEIELHGKGANHFRGNGQWGHSPIRISGSLSKDWKKIQAQLEGRADMNQIVPRLPENTPLPLTFQEPLKYQFSASLTRDRCTFLGEVFLGGVAVKGTAFSTASFGKKDKIVFHVDLEPQKTLHVKRAACNLGQSLLEVSGSWDLKDKENFTLKASTPKMDLEDLGLSCQGLQGPARGTVSCNAEARVSLGQSEKTTIKGEVEAHGLELVLKGLPSPVTNGRFKATFSEKKASIDYINANLGQSPIQIQGDLQGWDGVQGKVVVRSKDLHISDLVKDLSSPVSPQTAKAPGRFMEQTHVRFNAVVEKGVWKKFPYGPLETVGAFRAGDFYFDRLQVHTPYGTVWAKGHIKRGTDAHMLFSTHFKVTGQSVKELLQSLGIKERHVEGRVTMEGLLYMKGRNREELISSLTGNANLLLEKGIIWKSHLIFKVLEFLSIQKIFERRPADLSKEGFYFESIEGNISVNKGVLDSDNLVMKSPVFNAVAKGWLDLNKKRVELDLGTQPLGTVDGLVSRIPIVGHILTGKEKALLVYYFKVKGPIADPDVQYVPLKNLANSTLGIFKRLFFTPGRLYKGLEAMAQVLVKEGAPIPEEVYDNLEE